MLLNLTKHLKLETINFKDTKMETVKKFFGYILGGLGAILAVVFFFQKNKIDKLEKDAILAEVDKTDAVLATQQAAVSEKKAAVVQEIQAAKPEQAKDLDAASVEAYWNKK